MSYMYLQNLIPYLFLNIICYVQHVSTKFHNISIFAIFFMSNMFCYVQHVSTKFHSMFFLACSFMSYMYQQNLIPYLFLHIIFFMSYMYLQNVIPYLSLNIICYVQHVSTKFHNISIFAIFFMSNMFCYVQHVSTKFHSMFFLACSFMSYMYQQNLIPYLFLHIIFFMSYMYLQNVIPYIFLHTICYVQHVSTKFKSIPNLAYFFYVLHVSTKSHIIHIFTHHLLCPTCIYKISYHIYFYTLFVMSNMYLQNFIACLFWHVFYVLHVSTKSHTIYIFTHYLLCPTCIYKISKHA